MGGTPAAAAGSLLDERSVPVRVQANLKKNEAGMTLSNGSRSLGDVGQANAVSPTQNAMGIKTHGQGKIVVSGTNAFTHSFEPITGIGHFVFGDEDKTKHSNITASATTS